MATWLSRPIMPAPSDRQTSTTRHVTRGLLAPALSTVPRIARAHRLCDRVGIRGASPAADCRAIVDDAVDEISSIGSPLRVFAGRPMSVDDRDPRRRRRPVDGDRDATMPAKRELAPLGHGPLATVDDELAVLVEAAGRHVVDDRRRVPARAAPWSPLRASNDLSARPAPRAKLRMLGEMHRLAVHRHGDSADASRHTSARSSSRRGWPETCTSASRSVMTSTPASIRR